MATGAQVWSTTAGSNNSIDSAVNWAEGQAPSTVNDSARGGMASVASFIGDNSGTIATSGSTNAFTVTSKQVSTGVVDGYTIAARFHATNNAGATLNVDGVGPKTIQIYSGTSSLGGEIPAGSVQRLTYSSLSTGWILNGFRTSLGTIASSGSAAVPTITFGVDTDTGFYLPSGNNLGITVGGAQTVNLSTSTAAFTGNVTVSSSLDVAGNANFGGLSFNSATVASSFTVTGASLFAGVTETSATISSSLNVAGVSNLGGAVTMGSSLTVTGSALFAALTATTVTGTTVNGTTVQQAGATLIPSGVVVPYAGSSAPTGWLICDGSSQLRASFAALFTAIGTTYGNVDGTHFNLPDLRGRVPAGKESSASRLTSALGGVDGGTLGAVGGDQGNTLSESNLPSHSHGVNDTGHSHNPPNLGNATLSGSNFAIAITGYVGGTNGSFNTSSNQTGISIQNTGSDIAHANVQPTIILNYLIKT